MIGEAHTFIDTCCKAAFRVMIGKFIHKREPAVNQIDHS
jgi:hypothetical protein